MAGDGGSNENVTCFVYQMKITSRGLWYFRNDETPFRYSLPLLLFQMMLVFFLTQNVHSLFKRFGFPKIVSEFVAGLILTIIARNNTFKTMIFPPQANNVLGTVSTLGYMLFLFLIGVKMDVGMVNRTGRKAFGIGVLALLVPFILGMVSYTIIVKKMDKKLDPKTATVLAFVTINHAITPFPVIACLLNELKILNSELGRLALSSALVSDLLSVCLTTAGIYGRRIVDQHGTHRVKTYAPMGLTVLFLVTIVFVIRPSMFWMVRQTPEGRPVKDMYIFAIILAVFCCARLTDLCGLSVMFGPFILGLAVPDGPPLGSAIVNKLDTIVSGILLPLFVAAVGIKASIFVRIPLGFIGLNMFQVAITYIGKVLAILFVTTLICRMPFNDSLALALIMSSKGIVDFASYSLSRDDESLDENTFTMMVITIALIAAMVPVVVRSLYDPSRKYAGYKKRTIMHTKLTAELRMLVCIYNLDDIPGIVKTLQATSPSKESPMSVNVLHLIELIGRASPFFISHQLQKKTSYNEKSYSDTVLKSFDYYEEHNHGVVSVQAYTYVSPLNYMNEDICLHALDKMVSLIILPFHRKLAEDGMTFSENQGWRAVTCSVLDRAPCSVGILIDRGNAGSSVSTMLSQSSYNVAVVFLGGNDDREALAYATRMARDLSIDLTVIQFITEEDIWSKDWERMLDDEMLKDVKLNTLGHGNIEYREEVARDGAETALSIRSIQNDYDLIMVGRRHEMNCPLTSGLEEWSVFPELGVIGDLFASSDVVSRVSVLVVQQQEYHCT